MLRPCSIKDWPSRHTRLRRIPVLKPWAAPVGRGFSIAPLLAETFAQGLKFAIESVEAGEEDLLTLIFL